MPQTNPSHAINRNNLAENSTHPTGITTNCIRTWNWIEKWFLMEIERHRNYDSNSRTGSLFQCSFCGLVAGSISFSLWLRMKPISFGLVWSFISSERNAVDWQIEFENRMISEWKPQIWLEGGRRTDGWYWFIDTCFWIFSG